MPKDLYRILLDKEDEMKRLRNFGWFPFYEHNGNIDMYVLMIIPFVLYFSKSVIRKPEQYKGGTTLYSIHITPFISFSFAWRLS